MKLKYKLILGIFFLSVFSLKTPVSAEEKIQRNEQQFMYTVNFYGFQSELLSSQSVTPGSKIKIPNISERGYLFHGFNTKQDGSGTYIISEYPTCSQNYYAVFSDEVYYVNYYIDNTLLATRTVRYGQNAENIEVEEIDGYIFSSWSGLDRITEDRNIYAVYEKVAPSEGREGSIRYRLDYKEDNLTESKKVETFKISQDKNTKIYHSDKVNKEAESMPVWVFALIFVGLLVGFSYAVEKIKRKK